jgi:DNA-binding IclR family transcriptional regulator
MLTREAVGLMRGLVDHTSQTATLCVLHGDAIMYLLTVEGRLYVEHGWKTGSWLPYHCTAAGKVLVANLPNEEIDRIIRTVNRPRFTPQTICDGAVLRSQFVQIRKDGLAITHSEGTPGLGAQAVPVYNKHHSVVAALGLVYPEHLFSKKDESGLTTVLRNAARELSHRLGAVVYPHGDAIKAPELKASVRGARRSNQTLSAAGTRVAGRSARTIAGNQ